MSSSAGDLDESQKVALDLFHSGRSIALVGGGGSGKSFLLKRMIQDAEKKVGAFPFVAACAHSNKAAEALNGATVHKLFGAKPSWEFSKDYLLEGLKAKPWLCEQLKKIQILIIDELSLLTSNVLDAMDHVLRYYSASERLSSLPLGGRQLVVSGDPYQLEPYCSHACVQVDAHRTSFQSRTWYLKFGPPGDGVVINLKSNHRQSKDPFFFSMLNRIRIGSHTNQDIMVLNNLGASEEEPPAGHTRLCLKNEQVDKINERNLAEIPGPLFRLEASDNFFSGDSLNLQKRLDCVAPKAIYIKRGAHVIVTRKLATPKGAILPGAHAIVQSVDKCASTLGEMKLEIVVKKSANLNSYGPRTGSRTKPPYLHSACDTTVRISKAKFEVHRFDRTVVAEREQFPLIPAYALTIHRAQGMTFSRVAIDFQVARNWKPHGMSYVALSRCKSTSGLWVRGLRSSHISVSRRAKDVMKELWKLHVHMPARIWGVRNPSCLSLSDEVVSEKVLNATDSNVSVEINTLNSEGSVTPVEVLESSWQLCDTADTNRTTCEDEISVSESGETRSQAPVTKRAAYAMLDGTEDDSDIEVLFVGIIKRRRKTVRM